MKRITWDAPQLQNPNSPFLKKAKTFKELWAKGQEAEREQRAAEAFLQKAYPAMNALLEYKFQNREPFFVMRPLRYQSAEIEGSGGDEIDKSFYNSSKAQKEVPQFRDVIRTINPGTQLILKAIDTGLEEFIFADALGNEHCMHFAERHNLMTQTDIYETVVQYFESLNKEGE